MKNIQSDVQFLKLFHFKNYMSSLKSYLMIYLVAYIFVKMQEITLWHPNMIKTTIYKNQYNNIFIEIRLIMEDKIHVSKAYQCQLCGSYLLSKKGAKNHKCFFHK